MKTWMTCSMALGAMLVMAASGGCGGDDDPGSSSSSSGNSSASSSSTSGAGGNGSSSSSSSSSGTGGSASSSSSSGTAGAGGISELQECLDQAKQQPDVPCSECACNNCLAQLKTCEADPSCVGLRNCATANNCCEEICVAIHCGKELEAAGGIFGAGTAAVKAVKECTEQNTCNCCK